MRREESKVVELLRFYAIRGESINRSMFEMVASRIVDALIPCDHKWVDQPDHTAICLKCNEQTPF